MKKVLVMVAVGMMVPALALAKKPTSVSGTLNLNEATESQLELLPGIGPKVAKEIVAARVQKPFKKADDIRQIKGVGRATFAKIKDHLSVSGKSTLVAESGKPSKAPHRSQGERPEMED